MSASKEAKDIVPHATYLLAPPPERLVQLGGVDAPWMTLVGR
jgi:hypothetical protein